jgi:uncharacterized protein (TIGR02246 family)
MKIQILATVLLLVALLPSAFAKELMSQDETDSIVKQFQSDYAKCFDSRDAKSMVSMFTENATMQNEWGDVTQGRAKIEALVQHLMTKLPEKATLVDTSVASQCIAPDVIVSQGISRRLIPSAEEQQMFFTRVLVRSDKKWLLSATQIARPSTVPKPAPAPVQSH